MELEEFEGLGLKKIGSFNFIIEGKQGVSCGSNDDDEFYDLEEGLDFDFDVMDFILS